MQDFCLGEGTTNLTDLTNFAWVEQVVTAEDSEYAKRWIVLGLGCCLRRLTGFTGFLWGLIIFVMITAGGIGNSRRRNGRKGGLSLIHI